MNTITVQIGDHLVASRFGYTHHALYIGDGQVMHYLNDEGVTIDSFETFAKGEKTWVREHSCRRYTRKESVERAHSRFGNDNYNVIINNCEHFVNWCINGLHVSEQVNDIVLTIVGTLMEKQIVNKVAPTVMGKLLSTTVATSATAAGTAFVSSTATGGTVTAFASGVSTLASTATAVGGGAVILTAVPVAKGIQRAVNNYHVCDNPLELIVEFGKGAAECVEDAYESASECAGNIYDGITDCVEDVYEGVSDCVGDICEDVTECVGDVCESVGSFFSSIFD